MATFNKITLVGRIGSNLELKYTPQGTAVTNFSVATNDRKNVDGKWEDITIWFRVTVWGKQAETVTKFLSKGSLAYFEGRLTTSEWKDSEGNARVTLEVNCSDVHFLEPKASTNSAGGGAPNTSQAAATSPARPNPVDDDIPF